MSTIYMVLLVSWHQELQITLDMRLFGSSMGTIVCPMSHLCHYTSKINLKNFEQRGGK